ncbi:adenosylmethionine--8-amino-7-oxononanoate transaminase [Pelagibius sp. Alg239-R121]|uniref:adenosylmethionine--8-amino-7-oxononanoate transaminase n=1 Tax=Pelagibius sp. Alg239-R121 TaxID=2993448 RepID=UPI0024A66BB6|nr:adenosylmethionine--8-amino-7-oxononanoate transaminase [Pelagibius sp. Alg239-R121]
MQRTASPVWHPFTQHAITPKIPMIERGDGIYLYAADGTRYIDAISSWWVITHGHCYPRIQAAIRAQTEKLDQVIFAGYTHEPAEELARRLVEVTPDGLDYVFYSDSGSTSVEVALKMALGYWAHCGAARKRILVLENSYHGDTIGTMSVGERGVFNQPYEPLLFDVQSIPFRAAGREQDTLDALERACNAPDTPAAFIVEPLVLGAGGMLMYSPEVLREMKRICAAKDVLFIADEVMTGWGRTGTLFACEQAGVVPDIACYSKGITGGALPLAVTMCAARIFDAHYSEDRRKTFFHSSSYTANPVACAAGLENMRIWQEEPVGERIAAIEAMHERRLAEVRSDGRFENVRRRGTIAAMDVKVDSAGYLAGVGPKMLAYFQSQGLLLRPLGNTVYLMTPYCISEADMDLLYDTILACVGEVTGG